MIIAFFAFLIVFSSIVLVHEAGHFLAARRAGVPVYEFCLGFPFSPRLCTLFRHKETAFTVRLLPLGGFVSFAQADDDENNGVLAASAGQRALILAAGSLCNLIFAFGVFVFVYMAGQGFSFPAAIGASADLIVSIIAGTVGALWNLVAGQGGMDTLVGTVGIAALAGEAARHGLLTLLYFTGFLSLSLGIMNLFPLPALDGGQLLLLLLETIRRKPFALQTVQAVNLIGFLCLVLLSVFVTCRDLVTLLA
jgi:regulator of sigma E protease